MSAPREKLAYIELFLLLCSIHPGCQDLDELTWLFAFGSLETLSLAVLLIVALPCYFSYFVYFSFFTSMFHKEIEVW